MKDNQNLVRLGARIKLFRRQMQEWNALGIHQHKLRLLTREYEGQKDRSYNTHQIVVLQQITNQAIRLSQLIERQTEEREQMKARHQREDLALEQTINTHN